MTANIIHSVNVCLWKIDTNTHTSIIKYVSLKVRNGLLSVLPVEFLLPPIILSEQVVIECNEKGFF